MKRMTLPDALRGIFYLLMVTGFGRICPGSSEPLEQALIESVLEKYIDSQGGRELLASVQTFEVRGTISLESQGLEIAVIQKIQTPDKVVLIEEFPAIGTIRNVLNGNRGWEWHPLSGQRPLDENEVKDLLKNADLQRDLKLPEVYESIRVGSPEIIEGIETTQLIFLDDNGREEHWYFKDNGDLFQKIHTVSTGPDSELESTERFYDFTSLQGFRFPRRIQYLNPVYTAELTIDLCLIDQVFDQAIFDLPASADPSASGWQF